jgi:rod shape determining protein RodA
MFAVHIIINVGMTMGLTPITGIPLPFVSYGGSSMLTNIIAIGIILGVGLRKTGLRF